MQTEKQLAYLKVVSISDSRSILQQLKVLMKSIGVSEYYSLKPTNEAILSLTEIQPNVCYIDIPDGSNCKNVVELVKKIKAFLPICSFVLLGSDIDINGQSFLSNCGMSSMSSIINKDLSATKLKNSLRLSLLQLENHQLKSKLVSRLSLEGGPLNSMIKVRSNLFFKVGDRYKSMDVKKIKYFFSENKVRQARVENRNYPTSVQLKTLAEELKPVFLRCHKKFLVNTTYIDNVLPRENKIIIGDELIPIGYHYKKSFLNGLFIVK